MYGDFSHEDKRGSIPNRGDARRYVARGLKRRKYLRTDYNACLTTSNGVWLEILMLRARPRAQVEKKDRREKRLTGGPEQL